MNVQTIKMDPELARAKVREYRQGLVAKAADLHRERLAILAGYRALAKGHVLLNLHDALAQAGFDHEVKPRLAICRAHFRWCFFHPSGSAFVGSDESNMRDWDLAKKGRSRWAGVGMPPGQRPAVLRDHHRPYDKVHAAVPLIPPALQPKAALSNYHLLWEPKWENVAPEDPLLLRHLHGALYVVLAQWDLTELERAVMGERFA